ncbi:carbohydrate sulfotransferase 11-like [Protopterus annectens]|uniref:carbohydrate sulfotransferase 11-like n=1 Tax=Protopterus annectens TaxID=7888 RepID=UPI001CF99BDD|nr:carbohydrate sulfotransferase 11-like [Protopterus annectens]
MHFYSRIILIVFVCACLFCLKWILETQESWQIRDIQALPTQMGITLDTFLHVQQLRKQKMKYFCAGTSQAQKVLKSHLSSLVANDKYEVIYCDIPHTGTGSWKQFLNTIEDKEEITLDSPVSNGHIAAPFTDLRDYNLTMATRLLQSYTKIIFMRDPFQRLLLHYLHFFSLQTNFSEFIQHILNKGHRNNVMWAPLVSLCYPCHIKYDYIINYHFLREEMHYMMRRLGMFVKVSYSSFDDNTFQGTFKWMTNRYFHNISKEQKKQLLQYYSPDLLAFHLLKLPWN